MVKKSQKIEETVQGILDFFKASKREKFLPEVVKKLEEISQKSKEEQIVYVYTAVRLKEKELAKILNYLKLLFNGELKIKNLIDKKILGGFKIKFGDFNLDLSLRNELELLKRKVWQP